MMTHGPNSAISSARQAKALLVTFSGLDGSGKTTQIENLHRLALDLGLRTRVVEFWSDIVVGTSVREGFVHTVYGSEKGVGQPNRPVRRRDKNVKAWYLTVARHILYLVDALSARRVIRRAARGADLVIIDRYIYDEFASLPLERAFSRVFMHALSEIAPQPDLALILDADPEAAHARKPEYTVDFMQQSRACYQELCARLRGLTLVPVLPLKQATAAVENCFMGLAGRRSTRPEQGQTTAA